MPFTEVWVKKLSVDEWVKQSPSCRLAQNVLLIADGLLCIRVTSVPVRFMCVQQEWRDAHCEQTIWF